MHYIRQVVHTVGTHPFSKKMPTPTGKRKCTGKFLNEWTATFGRLIVGSKAGEQYVRCVVCSRDVKVAASDLYDVKEHMNSKLHASNLKMHEDATTVRDFFKPRTNSDTEAAETVKRAVVLFSYFIGEHLTSLPPPATTSPSCAELCFPTVPSQNALDATYENNTGYQEVLGNRIDSVSS